MLSESDEAASLYTASSCTSQEAWASARGGSVTASHAIEGNVRNETARLIGRSLRGRSES